MIKDREGFWKYAEENRDALISFLREGTGQLDARLDVFLETRNTALVLLLIMARRNTDYVAPALRPLLQALPLFQAEIDPQSQVEKSGLSEAESREQTIREAIHEFLGNDPIARQIEDLVADTILLDNGERLAELGATLAAANGLVLAVSTLGGAIPRDLLLAHTAAVSEAAEATRVIGTAYDIHRILLQKGTS